MLRKLRYYLEFHKNASFDKLAKREQVYLYAGDIGTHTLQGPIPFIGLSLYKSDPRHIKHDVTNKILLPDNSVDIYQSEDVFEHLEYDHLLPIMNEVFRVLKPNGLFRLSLPDYRCNILDSRSLKDDEGNVVFDPGGGGSYKEGKIIDGGHLWFPTYELVAFLLDRSDFKNHGRIEFLHYYDDQFNSVTKQIDHGKGIVSRTPDFDKRVQHPLRALSIVVDAYKS